MAYADDTLVLLDDPAEMPALQTIISMYSNASNALLNFGKTEAFSLSGSTLPLWRTYLQQLSPPITSWHDKSALSPLIYLGYPVYCSVTQRNQFVDQLLTKVKLSSMACSPSGTPHNDTTCFIPQSRQCFSEQLSLSSYSVSRACPV
ncbi:hypothetical protein G6F41_013820 [Rhizopus arrhizus]|nr:hypothetical protein G6F41_013820 [Rhizopus arrhizus]